MEVRRIAEQHSRDRNGGRRCAEGGDRYSALEPLHQFLKDKDGARDWRVEGRSEAGAGSRRNQHTAVRPGSPEHPPHEMSETRPHLDARTFAAKREAGADGKQSGKELYGDQAKRGRRKVRAQDRFDVRNAAARRLRRKAENQPGGERGRRRACRDNEQKANRPTAMSPRNQRVAQTVRRAERKPEDRPDKSRKRASDERKRREGQQAAAALALVVRHWLPPSSSRPRIAIFALLISAGKAGDT